MEMRDFWDQHKGKRVVIQFGNDVKVDGVVHDVMHGMLVLGSATNPSQLRYIPWPNTNVVSIEFAQPGRQ